MKRTCSCDLSADELNQGYGSSDSAPAKTHILGGTHGPVQLNPGAMTKTLVHVPGHCSRPPPHTVGKTSARVRGPAVPRRNPKGDSKRGRPKN